MPAVMLIGRISLNGGPAQECTIQGNATALQIWGGPIDPYPDHGLPGQPPHIWGPTDPRPTPPISGIPGLPGYQPPAERPPVIWGPTDPRPTVPIFWPGYPAWPPTGESPPPPADQWYWSYCADAGSWVLVPPGGGDRPRPLP